MADPTAMSCSTAVTGHVAKVTVCDRNKVVGPIPHGLAPLGIKEKSVDIQEPKDALYERAAELVAALRGIESHRKQDQVPCKHYAGIWVGCVLQAGSQRGHDGVQVARQHCRCLLNRHSGFLLFISCERHVLCDQITSDWVADPEGIVPVGGDAEIALVSHDQLGNVVCRQGIVCISLCTFPGLVEQPESSAVLTCAQCMAHTSVRLLLLQESNQHKNCTISLGWAVAIQTAPPVVRDVRNCLKRIVAASLLTVDDSFSKDVVNCMNRAPRAASSIDRVDPSALVV